MTAQGGPQLTRRLERLTGSGIADLRPVGSQRRWRHYYRGSLLDAARATLAA